MEGVRKKVVTSGADRAQARPGRKEDGTAEQWEDAREAGKQGWRCSLPSVGSQTKKQGVLWPVLVLEYHIECGC